MRDRDGNWTYQFAVVVDDWLQGVTLVVRGEDLLDSTAGFSSRGCLAVNSLRRFSTMRC